MTQYKATSLNRHLDQGWRFLSRELNEYIEVIPPQQRIAEMWYQGTADAIYQNVYTIEKAAPRDTLILAGDHIYKMNYARMIDYHRDSRADLTIACQPVPRQQSREFGVIGVEDDHRVVSFLEKPKDPQVIPDQPDKVLASMGIYVFNTDVMYELLFQDAARKEASNHDFGRDIIPAMMVEELRRLCVPFRDEKPQRGRVPGATFIRTLDAYFQTTMDLIQIDPILNLYDQDWPIHTHQPPYPPPKFVHTEGDRRRTLHQLHNVCQGAIISGGQVHQEHRIAWRADQQFRPDRRRHSFRRGGASAITPVSAARSSTRTSGFPWASRLAGTAAPTSPAVSPSPKTALPSSPRGKNSSGLGSRQTNSR